MKDIEEFFREAFSAFGEEDFALLFLINVSAFAAVFLIAFFSCIFSAKVRARSKKPFMCAVNLFSALTLAIFSLEFALSSAVCAAVVFRCAGYLLYGLICLFKPKRKPTDVISGSPVMCEAPRYTPPPEICVAPAVPPNVRLEHASAIADKLLAKTLGRGDRQELEKIKTSLTVFKVKGALTAQEGESLNLMFNSLLKLMAKYEV